MHKDVNVNVSGPVQPTSTYKTVVLKGQAPFASQVTESNTKYVIKHNFDLGGESVTIPEGCLLEFDGGALSNGTLVGQNTGIDAGLVKIFNTDVTLSGTWNVAEAYPEWFGAKGDGTTNDSDAINKTIKFSPNGAVVKFQQGKTYSAYINIFRNNITLIGYGTNLIGVSGVGGNVLTVGYPNYTGIGYDDSVDPSDQTWKPFNNIKVYGFDINGNYLNTPHSIESDLTGHGVLATLALRSVFKDLKIHDCHISCFYNESSYYTTVDVIVENGGNSPAITENNYYTNFEAGSTINCDYKIISIGGKHGCKLSNNCRYNNCNFIINDASLTGLRVTTSAPQNILNSNYVTAVIDGNNKCSLYGVSIYGETLDNVRGNILNITVKGCSGENATAIAGVSNIVNITSDGNSQKSLSVGGNGNIVSICSTNDGTALEGDITTPAIVCDGVRNKITANFKNFIGGRVLNNLSTSVNNCIEIITDKAMNILDLNKGKSSIKQRYNGRPLLWENNAPTSNVDAAFTISISNYLSNNFDYYLIEFADSTSNQNKRYLCYLDAQTAGIISSVSAIKLESNQTVIFNRDFKYDSAQGNIFFWGGVKSIDGTISDDNAVLIPLRVYGCYING